MVRKVVEPLRSGGVSGRRVQKGGRGADQWCGSDAEIFGAVMAENLHMNSNACVHYDTSLSNSGSEGANAVVAIWQEK